MQPPPEIPFLRRLELILALLGRAIGACSRARPALNPLLAIGARRAVRARDRFTALLALLAAGRRPRVQPPRPTRPPRPSRAGQPGQPRKSGWLIHLAGWQAAAAASQLRHWLAEPDVAELLAREPTAARALNPLCRMLDLPPLVKPPPRAAKPAKPECPERPPQPTLSQTERAPCPLSPWARVAERTEAGVRDAGVTKSRRNDLLAPPSPPNAPRWAVRDETIDPPDWWLPPSRARPA